MILSMYLVHCMYQFVKMKNLKQPLFLGKIWMNCWCLTFIDTDFICQLHLFWGGISVVSVSIATVYCSVAAPIIFVNFFLEKNRQKHCSSWLKQCQADRESEFQILPKWLHWYSNLFHKFMIFSFVHIWVFDPAFWNVLSRVSMKIYADVIIKQDQILCIGQLIIQIN